MHQIRAGFSTDVIRPFHSKPLRRHDECNGDISTTTPCGILNRRVDYAAGCFDPVFRFADSSGWRCNPMVRLARKAGWVASSDEAEVTATDATVAPKACASVLHFLRGSPSAVYLPRIQSCKGSDSAVARYSFPTIPVTREDERNRDITPTPNRT